MGSVYLMRPRHDRSTRCVWRWSSTAPETTVPTCVPKPDEAEEHAASCWSARRRARTSRLVQGPATIGYRGCAPTSRKPKNSCSLAAALKATTSRFANGPAFRVCDRRNRHLTTGDTPDTVDYEKVRDRHYASRCRVAASRDTSTIAFDGDVVDPQPTSRSGGAHSAIFGESTAGPSRASSSARKVSKVERAALDRARRNTRAVGLRIDRIALNLQRDGATDDDGLTSRWRNRRMDRPPLRV